MTNAHEEGALYIQYGCGFSAGEGWLNFDSSPTLRAERIPAIGGFISRHFKGNATRFPRSVMYGDICKGLPIAVGTARGAYASHVLEHLTLNECRRALANTYALLAPGGIFRMIVPDLHERARRYVQESADADPNAAHVFLKSSALGEEDRARSPIQHLVQLMGGSKHLWMWDESSMREELRRTGFIGVRRCDFGDATDPMFARVEHPNRFLDAATKIRECALEARKPG